MMESKIEWKGKMLFKAVSGTGHEISMDAALDNNGEDTGARPKEFVLHGLGGCTGMDVIAILRKMRNEPTSFRLEVSADQTDQHPKIFKNIHIKYIFSGEMDKEKVARAVELSQKSYCGVSEILRKSSELTYEIIYE